MNRLGVLLLIAGAVFGLTALWWWAVLGMTEPVGIAAAVTATGTMAAGIVCLAAADLSS